jgi:predicted RNase H-like nuclease (RuvC/YqgF family)
MPFDTKAVIEDLSEQVKQLSLNNTILRSMVQTAQRQIQELQEQMAEPPAE